MPEGTRNAGEAKRQLPTEPARRRIRAYVLNVDAHELSSTIVFGWGRQPADQWTVTVHLQDHPSQHVFPIQPPMRLGGFPQRILRRDGHADPAVTEVTIQLVEFTRIRDCVESTHAERAPRHRHRFDAVRVDDASLGPHEVETPLELGTSGERKHTVKSVRTTQTIAMHDHRQDSYS